jgi:type III pantothenate kinase
MKEPAQLVVDQGNTATKIALFENRVLKETWRFFDHEWSEHTPDLSHFPHRGIVSSVREKEFFPEAFALHFENFVRLREHSAFPFVVDYETPETLGSDRLANAAAAVFLFQDRPTLIVDCGTCITLTLVSKKKLMGGSISPGMRMRFEALHHFTGRLPLLETVYPIPDYTLGKTTSESIYSGVCNGIVGEIDHLITIYCKEFRGLNVVLTGGDSMYFAPRLKSPIFAEPNLTLIGLNEIFLYRHRGAD